MRDRRGSRRGSGGRRGRNNRSRSAPRKTGDSERLSRPLGAGVSEPEYAESVGASLEEAIEKALEVLHAREDEVDVEVLETGKRGFLGIGIKRPYRVRISWQKNESDEDQQEAPASAPPAEPARERSSADTSRRPRRSPSSRSSPPPRSDSPRRTELRTASQKPRSRRRPESQVEGGELNLADLSAADIAGLLGEADTITTRLIEMMGMTASVASHIEEDGLRIAVESEEDEALLIGRRGETRAALQQVINRILSKRTGVFTPVLVDVARYWERRVERLTRDAHELADRAVQSGLKTQSEPLSPQERRVIHRALTGDDRVTTESIGKGLHKSVLVQPTRARSSD